MVAQLTKTQLAGRIRQIIQERRLTQAEAGKIMGIAQPKVSTLLGGQLKNFSSDKLIQLLTLLSKEVQIIIRPSSQSGAKGKVVVTEAAVALPKPLLANANDLIDWAKQVSSRSELPRLIRRLVLASSGGRAQASFRAGEGADLSGWDGTTSCEIGRHYVPSGVTGWELSVEKDPRRKAERCFNVRTANPLALDAAKSHFVFATPRRWTRKQAWVQEKMGTGPWRSVQALDADDLESWLESTPSVHVWFSHLIGKLPEGVVDPETFWRDWLNSTKPSLDAKFVLAGRETAAALIQERLVSSDAPFSIRTESQDQDEAVAMLCASIFGLPEENREKVTSSTIIVRSPAAWERLLVSKVPMTLIPLLGDTEMATHGAASGHRIIVPMGRHQTGRLSGSDVVTIPPIAVKGASLALCEIGLPEAESGPLAVLARRSMRALRRRISRLPNFREPLWAGPSNASDALPYFLAGEWNEGYEKDLEILAMLAQSDSSRVQQTAIRWAREDDPLLRRTGSAWYVVSKDDAWELLASSLTQGDLDRLRRAVLELLTATDPHLDVPEARRFFVPGRLPYSPALRHGLAETLAIMGARGTEYRVAGHTVNRWVSEIVREILSKANNDWRIWASQSDLPLLAEAAPDAFLDATDEGLQGTQPIVKLFQHTGNPIWNAGYHTGLLWALEVLAWSPEYTGRAVEILAKLARLDPEPESNFHNRPLRSLRDTFVLWHPQTGAPWEKQAGVLQRLLDSEGEIGWQLHLALLPRMFDAVDDRIRPRWRDWAPDGRPKVVPAEYADRVFHLIRRMLVAAGTCGRRWASLIEALPNLPPNLYDEALKVLADVDPQGLSDDDRSAIWDSLRRVIANHRSFPTAAWALPAERLKKMEVLMDRFEPTDWVSRNSWLFEDVARLPGSTTDWSAADDELRDARRKQIRALLDDEGLPTIESLIGRVKSAFALGEALGMAGLEETDGDRIIGNYVGSEDQQFYRFAQGFLVGSCRSLGASWLKSRLDKIALSTKQQAEVLRVLAFFGDPPEVWALADRDSSVDEAYWTQIPPGVKGTRNVEYAAGRLLRYGHCVDAVQVLSLHLNEIQNLGLVTNALEAVIELEWAGTKLDLGLLVFGIGRLLDHLVSSGTAPGRVARLEWGVAPLMRFNRLPTALHQELACNPELFAELVAAIYRREGSDTVDAEVSDADCNRAAIAYDVLSKLASVPGASGPGNAVDLNVLEGWTRRALAKGAELDRPTFVARHIGEVLAHSPVGSDGIWPHEAIRTVIQNTSNRQLEEGFERSAFNSRGPTSRSLTEGGRQEKSIADQYATWAAATSAYWPRVASILRRLEQTYRDFAGHHDQMADLRQDGIWSHS